jgi:hypothetical protein
MSQRYRDVLDYEIGARIVVEFTTRGHEVTNYAVVLTVDDEDGEATTVRVVRRGTRSQRHAPAQPPR